MSCCLLLLSATAFRFRSILLFATGLILVLFEKYCEDDDDDDGQLAVFLKRLVCLFVALLSFSLRICVDSRSRCRDASGGR